MTQSYSEKMRFSLSVQQHLSHTRSFGATLSENLPKQIGDASVAAAFHAQGAAPGTNILSRYLRSSSFHGRPASSSLTSHGMLPSQAGVNAEIEAIRPAIAQCRHGATAIDQGCVMHLTVNADCVTQLRHLVIGTCGEPVAFMRIQPIAHATRMKVWLGLSKAGVERIMAIVMQNLPGAEFGPVRPL